jgi:hypothetical protein
VGVGEEGAAWAWACARARARARARAWVGGKMSKRKCKDKAERDPLEDRGRDSTVCTSVTKDTFGPFDALVAAPNAPRVPTLVATLLEEAVEENNKVSHFALCLANGHVMRLIESSNAELLPETFGRQFFTQCYRAVSRNAIRGKRDDREIWKTRDEIFGKGVTFPVTGNSNIVQYEADKMVANLDVYNSTDIIVAHMARYLRAKHGLPVRGHGKFLASRVAAEVPLDFETLPRTLQMDMAAVRAAIDEEVPAFLRARENDREMAIYRHRLFREMNQAVEDMDNEFGDDAPVRGVKQFSLLPLPTISRSYIDLDLFTMQKLRCKLEPDREELAPESRFKAWSQAERRRVYEDGRAAVSLDYFVRRRARNGWQLGSTFRTNGFELHVIYERNVTRNVMESGGKRRKADPDKKHTCKPDDFDPDKTCKPEWLVGAHDVVGVDPGNHNVVFGASWDGEHNADGERVFKHRRYTAKEYRRNSLRDALNARSERLTSRAQDAGLLGTLAEHPVKIAANFQSFAAGVRARVGVYDELYKIYSNRQFQKYKFAARRATQRTMDGLLERISEGGVKALAWGDCSRTTGIRGTQPGGPVKKLRRHAVKKGYKVFMVNEAYTTKRSVCCPNGDHPTNGNWRDNRGVKVHGILVCNDCGRLWNRDKVGSINIYDIAVAVVNNEPRPARFVRGFDPPGIAHAAAA